MLNACGLISRNNCSSESFRRFTSLNNPNCVSLNHTVTLPNGSSISKPLTSFQVSCYATKSSVKKKSANVTQKKPFRAAVKPSKPKTSVASKSKGAALKSNSESPKPKSSTKSASSKSKKGSSNLSQDRKKVEPDVEKPGTLEHPSHKPKLRPHIIRDLERANQFKHNIRKVTSSLDKTAESSGELKADEDKTLKQKIYNPAFSKLQIMGPLLRGIYEMGWKKPTPVQEGTIPLAIRGLNIVASAETGTGKTGAFAIPMLQRIHIRKKYEESRGIDRISAPLGVILCPTRELAEQVEDQIFEHAKFMDGMRIVGLSGAMKDVDLQIRELKKGVDILVATPGRLLRLLNETTTKEDEIDDAVAAVPEFEQETTKQHMEDDDAIDTLDEYEGFDENIDEFDEYEIGDELEMEDELEQVGEKDFNQSFKSLVSLDSNNKKPMIEKKEKIQKKEKLYSTWDKAWNEMERVTPTGTGNFRERLPFLPHGQAVKNSNIDLTHVRFLALDEVDRMLAMGMFPEVRHLFRAMPRPQGKRDPERLQVYMFTATLVPRIRELIKRFAPHHIRVDLNKAMRTAENVKQVFYSVGNRRKHALLTYLLRRRGSMKGSQVLVFCRTRQRVERLAEQLSNEDGFKAAGIHGDQTLHARQKILDEFRNGEIQILVSTEIMARGMDIPKLPFVVNYDLPHTPEEYIHRIGRTARAGNPGTAISFVSKEPSMIEVGKRLVELDENAYMESISNFLKKELYTSKVPGPWRDEAWNENLSEESTKKSKQDGKKQSRAKASSSELSDSTYYDVKLGKIVNKEGVEISTKSTKKYTYMEQDPELLSVVPPERNVNLKAETVLSRLYGKRTKQVEHAAKVAKGTKFVEDAKVVLKDKVRLRDFKEGRYEDVMDEFDTRRARKLGVFVPANLDYKLEEKRQQIHKKVQKKAKKQSMEL